MNEELYISFIRNGDPDLPKTLIEFMEFIIEMDDEILIVDTMWRDKFGD